MGQGSSVCVAMAIAVPVTREGGGEVKGQWLWRMVQLSPARPRHLAAAKSRRSREQEGEERWGGLEETSAFILKEEEKKI